MERSIIGLNFPFFLGLMNRREKWSGVGTSISRIIPESNHFGTNARRAFAVLSEMVTSGGGSIDNTGCSLNRNFRPSVIILVATSSPNDSHWDLCWDIIFLNLSSSVPGPSVGGEACCEKEK